MKNYILATVSVAALLASASVKAQEMPMAPPAEAAPAMPTEHHGMAPAMPEMPAPHHEMAAPAPAPAMPMEHHAAAHHAKHHAKHHGGMHRGANFVPFPYVNEYGVQFAPAYYGGNAECPYMYHGGYFWYPHAQGTLLRGYTPHYANGMYWYASWMHPHHVYVERRPMAYAYPYHMHYPMVMDRQVYMMER